MFSVLSTYKMYISSSYLVVFYIIATVVEQGSTATVDNCPQGVPRDQYLHIYHNWCFQFVYNKRRNYDNANRDCSSHGGSLALVKNSDIQQFLTILINNYVYVQGEEDAPLWIGLNDIVKEGTFVWEDGIPMIYSNWAAGEGQHHLLANSQDCVAIDPFDGKWIDDPCEESILDGLLGNNGKPYICQYNANNAPLTTATTTTQTIAVTATTTSLPNITST